MQQIVMLIIGEPATGKSAIMREVVKEGGFHLQERKWVPHYTSPDHSLLIVGSGYTDADQQFPGTDRLSMGVQPHMLDFIREKSNYTIALEGDRLGNSKFIETLLADGIRVRLGVVRTKPAILAKRRARERVQSETFVQSRRTKIVNLTERYSDHVVLLDNDTPSDIKSNAMWFLRATRIYAAKRVKAR